MLPLLIVSSARHLFPQFFPISHLERILSNENNAIWRDDIYNQNTLVPIDLEEQLQFVGLDCMDRGFPIFRRPFPTDWQKCVIYILFDCNRSQSMGLRATPTNCFFQSTLTDSLTQDKPLLLKSSKAETTFQDFCHKHTDFYTFDA